MTMTESTQQAPLVDGMHEAMGFGDHAGTLIACARDDIRVIRSKAEERVARFQEETMNLDEALLQAFLKLDEDSETLDQLLMYAEINIEKLYALRVAGPGADIGATLVAQGISSKIREVMQGVHQVIPESIQRSVACVEDCETCRQDGRTGWICELALLSCLAGVVL